jgi:hypothetical protein
MEGYSNVSAGEGSGIYVFDLVAAGYYNPPVSTRSASAVQSVSPEKGWSTQTNMDAKEIKSTTNYDLFGRVYNKKSVDNGRLKASQVTIYRDK